jgi:hypothetical protein
MKVAPVSADTIASDASLADVTSSVAPVTVAPKTPTRDKRAEAN